MNNDGAYGIGGGSQRAEHSRRCERGRCAPTVRRYRPHPTENTGLWGHYSAYLDHRQDPKRYRKRSKEGMYRVAMVRYWRGRMGQAKAVKYGSPAMIVQADASIGRIRGGHAMPSHGLRFVHDWECTPCEQSTRVGRNGAVCKGNQDESLRRV